MITALKINGRNVKALSYKIYYMIAHITIEEMNRGKSQKLNADLDAFEQRMQHYKDCFSSSKTPINTIDASTTEHEKMPCYRLNIQYLSDEDSERLQHEISNIVDNYYQQGTLMLPPTCIEHIDYDAPQRERGNIFSLTYLLRSHKEVETVFQAIEHAAIKTDNHEAAQLWGDMILRDEQAFKRSA